MREGERLSESLMHFMQMEECFRINMVLGMGMSDGEAYSLYENDGSIALLNELLKEEETFTEVFSTSGP